MLLLEEVLFCRPQHWPDASLFSSLANRSTRSSNTPSQLTCKSKQTKRERTRLIHTALTRRGRKQEEREKSEQESGREGKEEEETDWNHMERTRRRRRLLHLSKLIKAQHIAPLCFMASHCRSSPNGVSLCTLANFGPVSPADRQCEFKLRELQTPQVAEEGLTKSKLNQFMCQHFRELCLLLQWVKDNSLCGCKLANYRFAHKFGRVCTIFLPYISAKSTNKHWMCKIKR